MSYVVITTTDAAAITLMNSYSATLLSTQATFLVWLWNTPVSTDLSTVQKSIYCISFVTV